jgi:hypothetical protein
LAGVLHLRDTISHEGVSGALRGEGIPRWSKVECLVRILVNRAVGHLDIDVSLKHIHQLWLSATGVTSATVSPTKAQPSSTSENADASEREQKLPQRADAGDWSASVRLARLLADRGDLEGLRLMADRGGVDTPAARWLNALLVSRAHTGDRAAARELAERAAAGDEDAARLAQLDVIKRAAAFRADTPPQAETPGAQPSQASRDSRLDLTKLNPTEYEQLIRQLLEATGLENWTTERSELDGIDAIAISRNPFLGGLAVIQAKKYTQAVGVNHLHQLIGAMEEKQAGRGVLVTTSWFSQRCWALAAKNGRIELIDSVRLRHLVKEYLHIDVLAAPSPRNGEDSAPE